MLFFFSFFPFLFLLLLCSRQRHDGTEKKMATMLRLLRGVKGSLCAEEHLGAYGQGKVWKKRDESLSRTLCKMRRRKEEQEHAGASCWSAHPDDISETLRFVSQTNCRLCFPCYKTLTDSMGGSVATPRTLDSGRSLSSTVQKTTPPVRIFPPRKRTLAFEGEGDDSSMEALAGRSQSTKFAVNSALATMPANFVVFSTTVFD